MIKFFERHSKEDHADSIAAYLPNDDNFAAKGIDGKKLRQLLLGMGRGTRNAEDFLESVWEELDPASTTSFLEDWESAVGIPDACFDTTVSLEDRRRNVIIKLNAAVQTAPDFEELAALFGFNVTVNSGVQFTSFPFSFPLFFFGSSLESKFTIVVEFSEPITTGFPFTFPFSFGDGDIETMFCFFNKLKPANTQLLFKGG